MKKIKDDKSETSQDTGTFANGEKRYQWPPPRDPNLSYKEKTRNPISSLITALPLIMLVAGLYIYYKGESEQNSGTPIEAESTELSAIFTGLSVTRDRHYLWVDIEGVSKGIRFKQDQLAGLESMTRGQSVLVKMAPSVAGSKTLWALQVEQSGELFLESNLR